MPYLVDGNNFGGALGGAEGARDRERVLRWILDWCRRRRRAVIVFDGRPDPTLARGYGRVQIRYSGSRTGDSVIRELVVADPGRWVVVTDDRELRRRCRDEGATTLSARELVRARGEESRKPEEAPKHEGPVDIEDWLDYFEEDEDRCG